jgi:glutamate racemase
VEESFLYFGDMANMPYGRYDSEGRSDFLRELTLKDVQFLLGKTYHLHPEDKEPRRDKPQVKAIVIACNTATAYGLELIRKAVREWDLDMAVIGIVDAGSRAAGTRLTERDGPHMVGVFATEGTCASLGYPSAVAHNFSELGSGPVEVFQQPGFGWAGAVDGDPAYIDPQAGKVRGRNVYQGPGIGHARYPIEPERMREYRFDREGGALLVREDSQGRAVEIELNSVTNYIRFYVTRMVLEVLRNHPGRSLDAVILGCTHYPFFKQEIREQFNYLRGLDKSYAVIIPADLPLVDPAVSEAAELYEYLRREMLFGTNSFRDSRFFISVPNPNLARNRVDDLGAFPLEFKYGRSVNQSLAYVRRVPLTGARLAPDVLARIRDKSPLIFEIMKLDESLPSRTGF